MRRSAPFLQTGTPQLWSGKFLPLKHEAERRIFSVLLSGALHFFRITKRKARFAPNSVPERRKYYVRSKAECAVALRWPAFRSVSGLRSAP